MREKIQSFSIISVGILACGVLAFIGFKYVLPVLMPFLIAFLVAAITKSPAKRLSDRTRVPERIYRLMMSLFLTLISILFVLLIFWQATLALRNFLSDMGEGNRVYDIITSILSPTSSIFGDVIPSGLAEKISENLGALMTNALSGVASLVTTVAGALPQVFLFILVTLISLVYFSLDYDRITSAAVKLLPRRAREALVSLKEGVIDATVKYLRSYLLIMLITYGTMLLGLFILRVEHSAVIALFIALLDILPVLGVGTVLVPWSIFELFWGTRFLGIGLMLLFILNAVLRQIIEPKIVGKSLNLHPIVTLILLYAGYAIFGILGLLLLPMLAAVISSVLNKSDLNDDSSAEVG
ncbi:MAG: sporulation integral membrane protein YtvI [Clostridia bacterium]|nr:sporulation integral membrane protein YtvI [Clostridia bacterium]